MLDLKNSVTQQTAMEAFFLGYQAFTAKADEIACAPRVGPGASPHPVFYRPLPRPQRQRTACRPRREQASAEYPAAAVAGDAVGTKRYGRRRQTQTPARLSLPVLPELAPRREQAKLLQRVFGETGEAAVHGWLAVNQALGNTRPTGTN